MVVRHGRIEISLTASHKICISSETIECKRIGDVYRALYLVKHANTGSSSYLSAGTRGSGGKYSGSFSGIDYERLGKKEERHERIRERDTIETL